MMCSASRVLVTALALVTFSACFRQQYAALYVRSEPENAQAWSGKSGQYLGDTPFVLRYERTNGDANPVAVIVFKKTGFQTSFTIVEIDRWRSTWAEANVDQNVASVTLEPIGASSVPKTSEAATNSSGTLLSNIQNRDVRGRPLLRCTPRE